MNTTTRSVLVRLAAPAALILASVGLTASPAAAAKSDCPSGAFCVWKSASYSGAIKVIDDVGVYTNITFTTTGSYYNNRSKVTRLYSASGGGGTAQCIGPGGSDSSTSGWQATAKSAYPTNLSSC